MHRVVFKLLGALCVLCGNFSASAQTPPIEPGVSHELAKWRAARYSDVRYKLNLTLEKMSPVLKGTIEIRVKVNTAPGEQGTVPWGVPIVLDWRKIRGSESLSTVSNASVNGENVTPLQGSGRVLDVAEPVYENRSEHLIFMDAVRPGENVIKLDFTSPILTSGSAITRYVDKEDGAEYIYSLFVPSDASTAFPVFDQPDLKARFEVAVNAPPDWSVVSNGRQWSTNHLVPVESPEREYRIVHSFNESKPISTYVFAFAAGPFESFEERPRREILDEILREKGGLLEQDYSNPKYVNEAEIRARNIVIYVRKSQAAKFKPHAAEVFRLNREGIKYLEQYFDYKFPFPKYDIVLIPEFPFGGMEHAGATFLREASIIFPQEPTKSDYISRANLIFHEAAHQWFGDTVTMKWFDDLWLKEGFAEFMAYKTLEKVMPEANAWKVFYERNKQAAYLTDSTKGTTPIYQEIANLNSAKSAYGNIVYRKAPSFLKQAEFYLGPDKFQTAVRAFLKKHEYANAGWEDLVKEFGNAGFGNENEIGSFYKKVELQDWANQWIKQPGLPIITVPRLSFTINRSVASIVFSQRSIQSDSATNRFWTEKFRALIIYGDGQRQELEIEAHPFGEVARMYTLTPPDRTRPTGLAAVIPNYQDYGYGIFLLDDKSRDYVLKNIGSEKDDFLRSMMWGSLWDSVREGELDPKEYVELA
ncbi:MAG: M1 family aminopeptidase, partial [Pyrinomonadaceae bacterium]